MITRARAWRSAARAILLWAAGVLPATAALSSPLPVPPAPPALPADPQLNDPAPAGAAAPVSDLRLEVNVPAFRLDVYLGEQQLASYPITAGKPNEPTDPGRHEIRSVIWNPWWHPPAHRRPKDRVTPPGPRNPMGRVKLPLRGMYYIHGTARDHEIGRAASRGCVRMRNDDVLALTRLIHRHAGPPTLSPAEIEALEANPRRTRQLRLALPVPVEIVYRLAEVREGRLTTYRDVYRLATRPLSELATAALAEAGVPPERLDRTALDVALAREPVGDLPVASLLRSGDATPESIEAAPAGLATTALVEVAGSAP